MRSTSPSLLQPVTSTSIDEIGQEFVSSIEQEESDSPMFNNDDDDDDDDYDLMLKVKRCFSHNSKQLFKDQLNSSLNRKSTHRHRSNNNSSVEEKPSRLHRIRSSSTTILKDNEIKSTIDSLRRRNSTSSTDLTNQIQTNNSETVVLDKVSFLLEISFKPKSLFIQ